MEANVHPLRNAREAHNLTREQLAREIGIGSATIKRAERGDPISPESRRRLCAFFEKTSEELGLTPRHSLSFWQIATTPPEDLMATPSDGQTVQEQSNIILLSRELSEWVVMLLSSGETAMASLNSSKKAALVKLLSMDAKEKIVLAPSSMEPQQSTLLTATQSRRQAIAAIVGTTAAALGLSQTIGLSQLHLEEVLMLCASNIPLCWSLYFEGGLTEAKKYITPYLSQLSTLASYPTPYQKKVAVLASQAHQLSTLIEVLSHNLGVALERAKQASEFASLTEDFSLMTAAQIRLAVVYSNLNRPQQRLMAYEQALRYCQPTSPLLQARVYAGLTETHSALGNEKAAFHFLDQTNQMTPIQYESDPNFSYTHFDPWSIHMYEKDFYVNLGRPKDAWKVLEKSHQVVEQELTVNRVDLTVKQAEISLLLGGLEQSRSYLISAAEGATALGSQLLTESVHNIYMDMRRKWPKEQSVLELEEQLKLA